MSVWLQELSAKILSNTVLAMRERLAAQQDAIHQALAGQGCQRSSTFAFVVSWTYMQLLTRCSGLTRQVVATVH